jgi:tRNA dimethylallyltransferase
VRRAKAATRQLAKRQLTWMRAEQALVPLDAPAPDVLDRALAALPL